MKPNVLLAEAIGTFMLVGAGTGAIVFERMHGAPGTAGIAAVFGLAVWLAVGLFGPISGAHINPAVSVGFWLTGRLRGPPLCGYLAAQSAGALAASLGVSRYAPVDSTLGATIPTAAPGAAFLLEIALTAGLMSVILFVVNRPVRNSWLAGAGIGGWVALAAWFAGGVSGASMNPARSLGPALITGQVSWLWLYLSAPVTGAALGVLACRGARGGACCRRCTPVT